MKTEAAIDRFADFRRSERINGQVYLMAPAGLNHNLAAGSLHAAFKAYLKGSSCTALSGGTKVFLTEEDHFVPDMMVVCDRHKLSGRGVTGAPDLVIEVLSVNTVKNDRGKKKDAYEKAGVKEFWLVDPESRSVEQYVLENGRFVLRELYRCQVEEAAEKEVDGVHEEESDDPPPTEVRCALFEDLEIPLETVFEDFV